MPWQRFVAPALAFACIPIYAWLYLSSASIYPSPDERTVAVFAQHWAETGRFAISGVIAPELVPRSVTVVQDTFVPSGFLGLFFLIGFAWRLLGVIGAQLVVPILAAGVPWALYTLWKRVFPVSVARIAMVLTWVFPAWLYYAGRGFLPNVTFVSFLVYSLALAGYGWWGISGLCMGLALAIRPVEALWVLPLVCVLGWYTRPAWQALVRWILALIMPLIGLAYLQYQTYGSWLSVGYVAPSLEGQSSASVGLVSQLLAGWFPFGFHPVQAILRFAEQTITVYWWAVPCAIIGLVAIIKSSQKQSAYKMYSLVFLWVFAYLILYYGSWSITDHPSDNWITIGVAYHRYWLPVYLLAMPVMALGVDVLCAKWRLIRLRHWWPAGALLLSLATAFVWGEDSLWALRQHSVEYTSTRDWVLQNTDEKTILIVNREEKFLWPDRQVWFQPDQSYDFATRVSSVAPGFTLMWLTDLPLSHVQDLEQRIFTPANVRLEVVQQQGKYRLFRIEPLQP